MEEMLIAQMGLLLTQVRYARRAVEDLERNTATYGGFAFLRSLTPEARFGQPPLLNGALKVYVVNLNDLTASSGLGGFFEGLLGGIGRLFGGFLGGFAGGVISPGVLAVLVWKLAAISDNVKDIVARLGIGNPPPTPPPPPGAGGAAPAGAAPGADAASANVAVAQAAVAAEKEKAKEEGSFLDRLPPITDALLGLTALFRAAAAGPEIGAGSGPTDAQRAAMKETADFLRPVLDILTAVRDVVRGVTLLVPMLVGAFATLLMRIDTLKLVIVDLLMFVLRNVLLLRGAVLVTIYDTLSAAARLGASILRILAGAVDTILAALFGAIGKLLETLLGAIRFALNGLVNTINVLVPWLLDTVANVLTVIGNTRVFALVQHVIEVLPSILPALVRLVYNEELKGTELRLVQDLVKAGTRVPTVAPTGPLPAFKPPPDLASTAFPAGETGSFLKSVEDLGKGLRDDAKVSIGEAQQALKGIGATLDDRGFRDEMKKHYGELQGHTRSLTDAVAKAQQDTAKRPDTGLAAIANAYEEWLKGDGLKSVLENVNAFFVGQPAGKAADGLPGKVVVEASVQRARATVEIAEVVVEIEPPPGAAAGDAKDAKPAAALAPALDPAALARRMEEERWELEERGAPLGLPAFALG